MTHADAPGPPYFADERHSLYVGWVAGIAMRNGIPFELRCDPQGNYTGEMNITLPCVYNGVQITANSVTITVTIPYPPDDWTFE